MLPVSSWPPGPPGASLSPFGRPREVRVGDHRHGFVIPKGAWIVRTGSNRVVMFTPRVELTNPPRTPGTGYLPGQIPPRRSAPPPPPPRPPSRDNSFWAGPGQVSFSKEGTATVSMSLSRPNGAPCPPCPPPPPSPPRSPRWRRFNDVVEAFRAWQRATGQTDPPLRPLAGRRPPNWFGWRFVDAPGSTLVQPGSTGLVVADGQNVVIAGGGFATITQAYSV
jgi:hypothetical protein